MICYPLVSICIPVYNSIKYIRNCVDSALSQTYPNLEIIISDNCSTDGTYEYLKGLSDDRIRLNRNIVNVGMAENFNVVTRMATGKYIKYICADDYLESSCIMRMASEFEGDKTLSIVACERKIEFNGELKRQIGLHGVISGYAARNLLLLKGNYIGEPTCIMTKNEYAKRISYDVGLSQAIDIDFYIGLLKYGKVKILCESLAVFTKHENQQTEINKRQGTNADESIRFYRKHKNYPGAKYVLLNDRFGRLISSLLCFPYVIYLYYLAKKFTKMQTGG